jgi:hypothetical protein
MSEEQVRRNVGLLEEVLDDIFSSPAVRPCTVQSYLQRYTEDETGERNSG